MNRRNALKGLAGAAGGIVVADRTVHAQSPKTPVPGAIKVELGKEFMIGVQSTPVKVNESNIHLVLVGKGTFRLDHESRLTAELNAGVAQYVKVDYWISAAVFDAAGKLRGTAGHKESVEYVRIGRWPTVAREIMLDFGISNAFKDIAIVVVAISDRDVRKPG
jgi:hypothetical protein